eukprot:m.58359 g.58359  ORF g.58359 m.58359 type:complete len:2175 (+) comp22536_c0_seq1:290-6814(+)
MNANSDKMLVVTLESRVEIVKAHADDSFGDVKNASAGSNAISQTPFAPSQTTTAEVQRTETSPQSSANVEQAYSWRNLGVSAMEARREELISMTIEDNPALVEEWVALLHARVRLEPSHTPLLQSSHSPQIYKKVVMTERMRNYPGLGWSCELLPTDPGCWHRHDTSKDFKPRIETISEFKRPPDTRSWCGATWSPSYGVFGEHDGWEYAIDFSAKFHRCQTSMSFVRQRSWERWSVLNHQPYSWESIPLQEQRGILLEAQSGNSLLADEYRFLLATIDWRQEMETAPQMCMRPNQLKHPHPHPNRSQDDQHTIDTILRDYSTDMWLPHTLTSTCMGGLLFSHFVQGRCTTRFTIFTRRSHCRLCGLMLCSDCCRHVRKLPPAFRYTAEQKICLMCYALHEDGFITLATTPQQMILCRNTALKQNEPISLVLPSTHDHDNPSELAHKQRLSCLQDLGLDADNYEESAVKKAYYRLMREVHPDRQLGATWDKDRHERIQRAYDYLTRTVADVESDDLKEAKLHKQEENNRAYDAVTQYAMVHRKKRAKDSFDECPHCKRQFGIFRSKTLCPKCCMYVCKACASAKRPHHSIPNLIVRWCDQCVSLVETHGPTRLYPMLHGYAPLKGHDFLEAITGSVEVTANDDSMYVVRLCWRHHDDFAESRESSSASPSDSQKNTLRDISHCVTRTFSDFRFFDQHLKDLIGVIECPLPKKTLSDYVKVLQGKVFETQAALIEQQFLQARCEALTQYCQYVQCDLRISDQITKAKRNEMRDDEILAMQLARAFFSATKATWDTFTSSNGWFDRGVQSQSDLSLFDLQTMEYMDDMERYCWFLIEGSQTRHLIDQLHARQQQQHSREHRRETRQHERTERHKQFVAAESESALRISRLYQRHDKHNLRFDREQTRRKQQHSQATLLHIDREDDDVEYEHDYIEAKEDAAAFHHSETMYKSHFSAYEQAQRDIDVDRALYGDEKARPIPCEIVEWVLDNRSIVPSNSVDVDAITELQRRKAELGCSSEASVLRLETECKDYETELSTRQELELPNVTARQEQLTAERKLIDAEKQNLVFERKERESERSIRRTKEMAILHDLEDRECLTWQRGHTFYLREQLQAVRLCRGTERTNLQASREGKQTQQWLSGDAEESASQGRLQIETARCEAQCKLAHVLCFDRLDQDNGRQTCDAWNEATVKFLNDAEPANLAEAHETSQNRLDWKEESADLVVDVSNLNQRNPRTAIENPCKPDERVVEVYTQLQAHASSTMAAFLKELEVSSIPRSRDFDFEDTIRGRRLAVDKTLLEHDQQVDAESTRLNVEEERIAQEDMRLQLENTQHKEIRRLVGRVDVLRKDEDSQISNEIAKGAEKRDDIRLPIIQATRSIYATEDPSRCREAEVLARHAHAQDSATTVEAELHECRNRIVSLQHIATSIGNRVKTAGSQLERQSSETSRLHFPRSETHEERSTEQSTTSYLEPHHVTLSKQIAAAQLLKEDDLLKQQQCFTENKSMKSLCTTWNSEGCLRWHIYCAFDSEGRVRDVRLARAEDGDVHDRQFVEEIVQLLKQLDAALSSALARCGEEADALEEETHLQGRWSISISDAEYDATAERELYDKIVLGHAEENDLIEREQVLCEDKQQQVLQKMGEVQEQLVTNEIDHATMASDLDNYRAINRIICNEYTPVLQYVEHPNSIDADRWNSPLTGQVLRGAEQRVEQVEGWVRKIKKHGQLTRRHITRLNTLRTLLFNSNTVTLAEVWSTVGEHRPHHDDEWLVEHRPTLDYCQANMDKCLTQNAKLEDDLLETQTEFDRLASLANDVQLRLVLVRRQADASHKTALMLERQRIQDENRVEGFHKHAFDLVTEAQRSLESCQSLFRGCVSVEDDANRRSYKLTKWLGEHEDVPWGDRHSCDLLRGLHQTAIAFTADAVELAARVKEAKQSVQTSRELQSTCELELANTQVALERVTENNDVLGVGASGVGRKFFHKMQTKIGKTMRLYENGTNQFNMLAPSAAAIATKLRVCFQTVRAVAVKFEEFVEKVQLRYHRAQAAHDAYTARERRLNSNTKTLYHQSDAAHKILASKTFVRGSSGFAGGGIYFATDPADTHRKAHTSGGIVVAKVRLGNVFVYDGSSPQDFSFSSLEELGYDSVCITALNGDEYVVYNKDQAIPLRVISPSEQSDSD